MEDHDHRHAALATVGARTVGLCGHAHFETYSVLTRLPSPNRRSPGTIARLIQENFPANRQLSPEAASALLGKLAPADISGGSVYDALVAAAALESGLPLLTCPVGLPGAGGSLRVNPALSEGTQMTLQNSRAGEDISCAPAIFEVCQATFQSGRCCVYAARRRDGYVDPR